MTTVKALGGGAQPASIDTSGRMTGGPALRVYGFDSEADALAAGYVCEGGPAMSVALITDAQIASGEWKAEGDPAGLAVYTAPASMTVEGGYAVPVYAVNGWGSAPAPVPPLFVSAEIGTVNASTVAVTFDSNISASNYSAGVTIKVNGTATSITSATRQSNHAIVYYVIPVLWHGSGDVVTWEYASGSGNIVAESDSTPLGDVAAQTVTNNCEYTALLDLQADTGVSQSSNLVSAWGDQAESHNFTQTTEAAKPSLQTVGGYPTLNFAEGAGIYLNGQNWSEFDGVESFLVMTVHQFVYSSGHYYPPIFQKMDFDTGSGWDIEVDYYLSIWTSYSDFEFVWQVKADSPFDYDAWHVVSHVKNSISDLKLFVNGSEVGTISKFGTPTTFSNSQIAYIGSPYPDPLVVAANISAIMFFNPQPNATNRAALEVRLAARYGITL